MSEQDERETLAAVILARYGSFDPISAQGIADAILASDWLAARDQRIRAEFAPDGEDGHPCVRVEAYIAAEDARRRAEVQVAAVEALAEQWDRTGERLQGTHAAAGWFLVANQLRAALAAPSRDATDKEQRG